MAEREGRPPGEAESSPSAAGTERYLYCVVSVESCGDQPPTFGSGVDGGQPHLVTEGDLGAVVQPCEHQYDSGDPDTVKEWLLEHQAIVDEAGQAFGTPLPFRFDTVLEGDDDRVRGWLAEESAALGDALDDLAGLWEYRVELVWDAERLAERIEGDDRLAEIRERREAASDGEAFLLTKEYERRRASLADARREEVVRTLEDRLDDLAVEVEPVDRSASSSITGGRSGADEERHATAVLAPTDRETAIGDALDDLASDPAIEIRFTGPWPPYSFAPTIGEDR